MTRRIDSPDTNADVKIREILLAPEKQSFVVNAGAGSGKTTSLVKALNVLSETRGTALRSRGGRIACITYTEVAVGEIEMDVGQEDLFHISTIHSFLWSVVSPFQRDIRKWVALHIAEKIASLQEKNARPGTRPATKVKNNNEIDALTDDLVKLSAVKRFTYGVGSKYSEGILGHSDIISMVPDLVTSSHLLRKIVAQRFPYIFVDESQDTTVAVIEALKLIQIQEKEHFVLGFFGDPMQQIYSTGVGVIQHPDDWAVIDKPENFRCPSTVLNVINNIRRNQNPEALSQTFGGRSDDPSDARSNIGSANLFILPCDENRDENLGRVRIWLAETNDDELWSDDTADSGVRVLVIEHRQAAQRLGFSNLFMSFNDKGTEKLKSDFKEGKAWPLSPFLDVLMPLVLAVRNGKSFEVAQLMKSNSPIFGNLQTLARPSEELRELVSRLEELANLLLENPRATLRDVLVFALDNRIIDLDDRFRRVPLGDSGSIVEGADSAPQDDHDEDETLSSFLTVPANELWGYRDYVREQSVYGTQHGVKGAEYPRVIVLLEDDRSKFNLYSYNKLLGLENLSTSDLTNRDEGRETTLDRTRRLFYVCCSRATLGLAVVLYVDDPEHAAAVLRSEAIFPPTSIHTFHDLPARQ